MTELAPHISMFLRHHMPQERNASRHTVGSYTDSFVLLSRFAADRLGIRPSAITIEHLSSELVLDFLDYLERDRGNTVPTRNVRLAAIKSFFRYLEYRVPACLDVAQQISAIPMKRHDQTVIDCLDHDEVQALLDAPNTETAAGLRDRAMLHLAYCAGLRVSELVGVMLGDLGHPHADTVQVTGKGRRKRTLPLWKETSAVLRDWLAIRPAVGDDHVFLNARGTPISRHGFAHRLALHAATARKTMPSLASKRITPHVLRHACGLHTYEVTKDIRKVSLWLGHASIRSTEIYLRSDPIGKLEILARGVPPSIRKGAFADAPDRLMAILHDARAA